MKRLRYALLELERENKKTCDFCSNRYGKDNKSVSQIITRREETNKLIAVDVVCENCKEKFENDELLKCSKCGKLQTKIDLDVLSGKYNCRCEKEEQGKELPSLPHQRESMVGFYERQINGLREELNTAEVEIDTHLEALEISEDWHKRQKQELLDRIKELEVEVKRLKKQTPQELIEEINELKVQLQQLQEQNGQLTAQIEVKETKKWPWRLKK